jgi:SSS family solute:Na+ symporter
MGTAIGHDLYREYLMRGKIGHTVNITKLGIAVTILLSVVLAYVLPAGIIARATAIFFGLCAAAFLPMYIGALFWKRMTREGAIASLVVGTFSSLAWLTFVHAKEATALGISQAIFGQPTLLTGTWTLVDPILVATPLSMIVGIVISFITKPISKDHIEKCFGK